MTFKDGNWQSRVAPGGMGDEAESVFEEVYDKGFVRWGLNRPPLQVGKLPKKVAYAPDYLTTEGFVEVQGFGRDQILKIKWVKLNCLLWWDNVHPVFLFVWDSHRKRFTTVPLKTVANWIDDAKATIGYFHDSGAYFAVPAAVVFGA